jgi:hypothetical protein
MDLDNKNKTLCWGTTWPLVREIFLIARNKQIFLNEAMQERFRTPTNRYQSEQIFQ